jgi:glycosyltransferase involved in cell wall biosynthesis
MKKVAIIRGKFMTKYDMNIFENITKFRIIGFSSKNVEVNLSFPVVKLWSPMDLPEFPYKMQILNRLIVDAHYLFGLENNLKGFDIAHTSETYFHFTKQALDAKKHGYVKKVVCTVFENIPFNNEGIRGRKQFKKRAIQEIDKFIAVTAEVKEALVREGVDARKIEIIGMGIDTDKFSPPGNKDYSKKNLNILFVGRIEIFKGVFDVLDAFKLITNDKELNKYQLTLTIVGNGSMENKLTQKINKLGIQDKVLKEDSPYDLINTVYKKADIFIGPSKKDKYWKEQFGMVFLEAMSSGLPIISNDIGSIPEVVGEAGFLAKPGDVKELYKYLKYLIMDEKLRMEYSRKSRDRSINEFSIQKIGKRMEKLYLSIL